MAKIVGPAGSFTLRGQVGHTVTYQERGGSRLCRAYGVPPDPRTAQQLATRQVFTWLQSAWLTIPSTAANSWTGLANKRRSLPRAEWTGANVPGLRGASSLSSLLAAPRMNAAPGTPDWTATPAGTSITISLPAPPSPIGWTLNGARGVLLPDQDPHHAFAGAWLNRSDNTAPYSLLFSPLLHLTAYYVAVCWSWTRPDGLTARSPFVQHIVTTT